MKKLIFKKFSIDHALFFLYVALSVSLIVWVIQAVNFLDIVSEDGHSFRIYFYYTLLNLPKIFSRILPFIFFVSLFYIIIKYENKNELVIFWTVGIKKIEFVNVIIQLSFFYLIFQLLLTTLIVPKTQDYARSFIRSSDINFFTGLIKEKKFIDPVTGLTIFVDHKREDGTMENIFLKDTYSSDRYQIIYAKEGNFKTIKRKNFLSLYNGKVISNDSGKSTTFDFEKTEFNLSKYSTKTTTHPKVQEINTEILINCIYSIFKNNINNKLFDRYFSCNKKNSKNIKHELFKRIVIPFYLPLLSLIASILIARSKDHYNYNTFKVTLFFVGTLAIILSEMSVRYSHINYTFSLVFFLFPFFLFTTTYIFISNRLKILT